MKLLIFFLGALIVSAFAAPTTECSSDDYKTREGFWLSLYEEALDFKSPDSYGDWDAVSTFIEAVTKAVSAVKADTAEMAKEQKNFKNLMEHTPAFLYNLRDLLKATVVEGANPTDEELVALAKNMSKTLNENNAETDSFLASIVSDGLMDSDDVPALKKIVRNTKLSLSGNDFIDRLKGELPHLHTIGKTYRKFRKEFEDDATETEDTEGEEETTDQDLKTLVSQVIWEALISAMKNEEIAINTYKYIGALTRAIKNPSSYDSFDAMFNEFSKNERLEAYSILIKESFKCFANAVTEEQKNEFQKDKEYILKMMKAVYADSQNMDKDKLKQLVCETSGHSPNWDVYLEILVAMLEEDEKGKALQECLISEEDRISFYLTLPFTDDIYTKEKLDYIRTDNEKLYAFINILNGLVKIAREVKGLNAEAYDFVKKTITTPKMMLKAATLFNPPEMVVEGQTAITKKFIERFNNLSVEAKDSLVERLPCRTFVTLASFD